MSKDTATAIIGDIRIRRQGGRLKGVLKSFAIMRLAKVKTLGNMGASGRRMSWQSGTATPQGDPQKRRAWAGILHRRLP